MFPYDRRLAKEEAAVALLIHPSCSPAGSLLDTLRCASERFGFTLEIVESATNGAEVERVVRHGILLADATFYREILDSCPEHLRSLDTLSIAFEYPATTPPSNSRTFIDVDKERFSGRLNFIRPNTFDGARYRVSPQKIVDNAICDTIRVKYTPVCNGRSVTKLPDFEAAVAFFRYASAVYAENSMYHRASSDGYFAFRSDEGFFVTATKTCKINLDDQRISYVHTFDEMSSRLVYSGSFLPSSDSVECWIALHRLPNVQAMVHTHASELFTRNPSYRRYVKVPELPYGEADLGHRLGDALAVDPHGFVIMEDHGEVFAMAEPYSFHRKVQDLMSGAHSA